MLIRKWDAAQDDHEWRNFLTTHDFGEFIASGRNRDIPVIVPTHFVFDGESNIYLHLARANPIWPVLSENDRAVLSVTGAVSYIPTDVNGGRDEPSEYGVPTSYYASVQVSGPCEVLNGAELAAILSRQLAHFQPEGGHAPVEAGDNPYARQFDAIKGIHLRVEDVRAKFKFGGNKTLEHRMNIAAWLKEQPGEDAAEAHANLLRRTQAAQPKS